MGQNRYQSWGRYPKAEQTVLKMLWRHEPIPSSEGATGKILPFGNGRSYGDSCLNDGGTLIDTRSLDRFIQFDPEQGILRCEAGVLLSDIVDLVVPRGWFLPVTPATQYVTIGGAVANDIHGKNHHRSGTFGCHVSAFELLRSDGSRMLCSEIENPEWFSATIGGLGLTGVITWVEILLKPIMSPYVLEETIRFANLDEFFSISEESDTTFEYTVAWIDCTAKGERLGRGLFRRANHGAASLRGRRSTKYTAIALPIVPSALLVNRFSLRAVNSLYYRNQIQARRTRTKHFESFFYPLDAVGRWNWMYGPKGFLQYQCVLPHADGASALREMLEAVAASGLGSFLAALKLFGDRESPGLMSFARRGVTLALDFPNKPKAMELLDRLDEITRTAGGAVYPAKDARMSPKSYQAYFPKWEEFGRYIDPRCSSSFWRRVTGPAE
jgi:FAD/FMN-containing dehydrogenase